MRWVAVWVLLAGLIIGSHAVAQDATSAARASFAAGVKAFAAGRTNEALEAFREAYRLKPNPVVLYNIGQTEEAAGLPASAMVHLEQYLREAKNVPKERRDQVQRDIARLRQLAGVLTVEGGAPGATISLNGVTQGVAPLDRKLMVDPGRHHLLAEAEGFEPFDAQITVNAGEQRHIEIQQAKRSRPVAAGSAAREREPVERPTERVETARRQDVMRAPESAGPITPMGPLPAAPVDAPSNGISRGWFWGALTTTAVLGAAAATTGIIALSKSNDYNDPSTPIATRMQLMDSGPTWARTTDILLVATAVSAATTLFLYFKTDWGVQPTPGGMQLAGKF